MVHAVVRAEFLAFGWRTGSAACCKLPLSDSVCAPDSPPLSQDERRDRVGAQCSKKSRSACSACLTSVCIEPPIVAMTDWRHGISRNRFAGRGDRHQSMAAADCASTYCSLLRHRSADIGRWETCFDRDRRSPVAEPDGTRVANVARLFSGPGGADAGDIGPS